MFKARPKQRAFFIYRLLGHLKPLQQLINRTQIGINRTELRINMTLIRRTSGLTGPVGQGSGLQETVGFETGTWCRDIRYRRTMESQSESADRAGRTVNDRGSENAGRPKRFEGESKYVIFVALFVPLRPKSCEFDRNG